MPDQKTRVNIHNAPRVIGDYSMIISHPVVEMVDLLEIMVLIDDNLGIQFVFNSDLFPAVLRGVCDYVEFKRNYIRDCTNIIDNRTANSVPVSLEMLAVYSSVRANQHQLTPRRGRQPQQPVG